MFSYSGINLMNIVNMYIAQVKKVAEFAVLYCYLI